jgi:predicted DNA-binding transcriptional regulator YafY
MKSGDALVHVILYLRTRLMKKGRGGIRDLLMNDVVTFERIRRVVVAPRAKSSVENRGIKTREVVLEACRECRPVVICYRDSRWMRTGRMIEPLEVSRDSYTGMWKLRSYCYLRNAERTFLLDRIVNATPIDTNFSILE